MRISTCAELTGTTVRTIRYYHQIGLVPVPERVAGVRDYELEHVARVIRIRWLVEAGVPLEAVAGILADDDAAGGAESGGAKSGGPTGSGTATRGDGVGGTGRTGDAAGALLTEAGERTLRDLRAAAASVEQRMAQLRSQQERIGELIALAESGRGLRALPPGVERFYHVMVDRIGDERAAQMLRRELRLAEVLAMRGFVPERFDVLMSRMSEDDVAMFSDFYIGFAALSSLEPEVARREMDRLVAMVLEWSYANRTLVREYITALPRWAQQPDAMKRLIRLTTPFALDRRQAEVMHRLMPMFEEMLQPDPT